MGIRVLHIIPSMGMGGAERMVVDILRSLSPGDEFDFHLCALKSGEWFYPYQPNRPPDVLNHRGSWRSLRALLRTVGDLRKVIMKFQPHVIHSHLWFSDFTVGLANYRHGVPHIVHIHDTCEWKTSTRVGFRFRRWLYRSVLVRRHVRFVSCSHAVARLHRTAFGILDSQMAVIPYGVDLGVFCPRTPPRQRGGTITIGAAGRFVEMKGHEFLIQAFAKVREQSNHPVRLLLAGDGPLRGRYERLIEQLRLEEFVSVLGPVSNMAEFYRGLDLFVQPSISSEALPITVLEAMACGCPVVGTWVAGIPEAVSDGVNGFLVPPRDVDALAHAILKLCHDSALREQFAQVSLLRAQKEFSLGIMTEKIATLYRTVTK